MSSVAWKTLIAVAFFVSVIGAYGYGYKTGRSSQISFESAIEISKAQFTCRMERK